MEKFRITTSSRFKFKQKGGNIRFVSNMQQGLQIESPSHNFIHFIYTKTKINQTRESSLYKVLSYEIKIKLITQN